VIVRGIFGMVIVSAVAAWSRRIILGLAHSTKLFVKRPNL
jgi:hypothetical protein